MKKVRKKYDINDMKIAAIKRNGKCLSETYQNNRTRLQWECEFGHQWQATFSNISKGKWCARCSKLSLQEEKCRYVFETLTGKMFPTNNKVLGNKQHLDGYCKELNIAFEYDGEQHFNFISIWHKSKKDLKRQQKRDFHKTELCKKLGIKLIRIPYTHKGDIDTFMKLMEQKWLKTPLLVVFQKMYTTE